ncbi:MAG: nucleotidyltransferase family protein [Chitinophagales bacterium]|nr:nucleotidyltransferase family protein [Chitinophagaceae bacterium]MCB9065199.1 nucleotidyltransferase family protein [Chitinophagales bacterium]
MKAMLFAAGLGTRLKPFTDKHPKALARVNDTTLLEHSIRYLQKHGINDVVVNVHHFADQIEQVLNENNGFGSNITISDERDEVLETGGGLKKAAPHFQNEELFVVMNVDVLTNLNLSKVMDAHKQSKAMATLAVMERESSRHLLFDKTMNLCGWRNNKTGEEKMAKEASALKPFAFTGIHVLSPQILDMPFEGKFSIIDVYLHFAKTSTIKGYDHTGDLFLDVGKPETLAKAAELFQ